MSDGVIAEGVAERGVPGSVAEPEGDGGWLRRWSELPGGSVVWVFVVVELATFAMFFVGYAWARRGDPEVFRSSQQSLSVLSGTINTGILLTGSWLAARAALAHRHDRSSHGWLWGAALSGVVFTAVKVTEYAHVFGAGIHMSTNTFWFFYLFLTVMHLVHVLAGIGFAGVMAWRSRPGSAGRPSSESVEATAAYWHLVDLIWIVLFPLLYLAGR